MPTPRTAARLRAIATTTLEILGAAAVTTGVTLVSIPAGFITGGILAIAFSYFAVRGGIR